MLLIRLFVSSTFQDFLWERDTLRTSIIPIVNASLKDAGVGYELIDLREGVTKWSILEQDTARVCLAEVDEAFRAGTRPAFLFLNGSRRGWVTLPVIIDENTFTHLHAVAANSGEADLLDYWYEYDGNCLPSARKLKPRGDAYADPNHWAPVEENLRTIIQKASSSFEPNLKTSFSRTITEMEVERALFLETLLPGSLLGIRRVFTADHQSPIPKHYRDAISEHLSRDLWNSFIEVAQSSAIELQCQVDADGSLDADYRSAFSETLIDRLKTLAAQQRTRKEIGLPAFPRSAVSAARESVRRNIEDDIYHWLQDSDSSPVRLLSGNSGSGKSSVLKRVLRTVRAGHLANHSVALFIGDAYNMVDSDRFESALLNALNKQDLVNESRTRLDEALADLRERPLLLFIDAIEQAEWRDPSAAIAWLPPLFGQSWKILITCADAEIRDLFADAFGGDAVWELEEMSDAATMAQITNALAAVGRQVQSSQLEEIITSTKTLPGRGITNAVASAVAAFWTHSDTPSNLPYNLEGWLRLWLKSMSVDRRFGQTLPKILLALVTVSRHGIVEGNALKILQADDGINVWVNSSFPFGLTEPCLPRTLFAELISEMAGVLNITNHSGLRILQFSHRRIKEAFQGLLTTEALRDARLKLINYFDSQLQESGENTWQAMVQSAVSGVTFQMLMLREGQTASLEKLYSDPRFVALKTDALQMRDTLEELRLGRQCNYFNSRILQQVFGLIERRHVKLEAYLLEDRVSFISQTFEALELDSTPSQRATRPKETRENVLRVRIADPDLSGLTQLMRTIPTYSNIIADGPNFVVLTEQEAISVFDGSNGRELRTLPSHGADTAMFQHHSGKLVSYGSDGCLSISSIRAARELFRFNASVGPIAAAIELYGGCGFILVNKDKSVIERRDNKGQLTGRINVHESDEYQAYALGPNGLAPTSPVRVDLALLTVGMDAVQYLFPNIGSGLWSLSEDLLLTVGMSTAAVWSFGKAKMYFQLSQLFDQDESLKHIIPTTGNNILILTSGGGIYRLFPEEPRAEMIQRGTLKGGVSQIASSEYFAWSEQPSGQIIGTLINATTGLITRTLKLQAGESDRFEYFRGSASSVPRGVIPASGGFFAWSGYGCDFINTESGSIRKLNSYDMNEYCRFAVPVSDVHAALVLLSTPRIVEMHSGKTVIDFGPWIPGVEFAIGLGEGRALISCEDNRSYIWDMRESMQAARSSKFAEQASQLIPGVLGARILAGSRVGFQYSSFDSSALEYEVRSVDDSGQRTTGLWKSHTMEKGKHSSAMAIHELDSDTSNYGQVMLTWGHDGRVRIYDDENGLQEFKTADEAVIYSCTVAFVKHSDLGFYETARIEVLVLFTTATQLWCAMPARGILFEVPTSDDLAEPLGTKVFST